MLSKKYSLADQFTDEYSLRDYRYKFDIIDFICDMHLIVKHKNNTIISISIEDVQDNQYDCYIDTDYFIDKTFDDDESLKKLFINYIINTKDDYDTIKDFDLEIKIDSIKIVHKQNIEIFIDYSIIYRTTKFYTVYAFNKFIKNNDDIWYLFGRDVYECTFVYISEYEANSINPNLTEQEMLKMIKKSNKTILINLTKLPNCTKEVLESIIRQHASRKNQYYDLYVAIINNKNCDSKLIELLFDLSEVWTIACYNAAAASKYCPDKVKNKIIEYYNDKNNKKYFEEAMSILTKNG